MAKKITKILLVCANPRGTDPLRTAEEDRTLRQSIQLSPNKVKIEIETLNAATIDDLRRALLKNQFDIVHFSGHGTNTGLVFEDANGQLMVPSSGALAELFARRNVKTVLLNACYSLSVGKLTSIGLDYTIASTGAIADPAAIEFTRGFYDALGAGTTVPDAYEEGLSAAKLKGLEIDAILLARGEEYIPRPVLETELAPARSVASLPKTLVGIAVDTSGSMKDSIRNRTGDNLTRFSGVQDSLSEIGIHVRNELARKSAHIDDAFQVFIYAFGLRIGSGVADMASLWRATQNINLKEQIEILRRKYEAEARQSASSYGDLARLARSYGFGGVVDSIAEAAKDSVRQKIIGEITDQIFREAHRIGDSTLSADELAHLFDSSPTDGDESVVEHVIFGATPMAEAAREIHSRYERTISANYDQRTLLIISDGEPTDGDPREIFTSIQESGVTIIACFVTDEDIADPRLLVGEPQPSWKREARLMWDIASDLDETSAFARYLLTQGWSLEPNAKLFVQVNHSEVLKEFLKVAGSHFTTHAVGLLPNGR